MDILFIVPYVPDLVRVRPYNFIKSLTSRGHRVTVGTIWSNEAEMLSLERLRNECYQVYALKMSKWQALYNCIITVPTKKPLQAAYSWQPKLAALLGSFVTRNHHMYDVIHIEHLRGARYGLDLKSKMDRDNSLRNKPPIVWDSVDCISLLFRQASKKSGSILSRIITLFETERTSRFESWLINQFDEVTVTSPVDKAAFLAMTKPDKIQPNITIIPNGVDLEYFYPDFNIVREPNTLVLSGKMSYHANVTMALHLVNEIMPIIWSKKPEVKLWIVGKDPPERIKNLGQNPAIKVTGTVNDIRPFLQSATIAVAPITYGTGIQNKVLEAMSCATPVIASSQAVSALSICPGRDLMVADDPLSFATTVLELLADSQRRDALGAFGRKYVENYHDWAEISASLECKYRETIERIKRRPE